MVKHRSYWDVGVNVVVDFVNIAVDNVSIVDIVVVVVEIDGDNVVDSVVDCWSYWHNTDIVRRLKFWKNLTDWLSD